jgi:hypothetical protein
MNKNRRDEPIQFIVYIYMESHKETPRVAIFILNKQKPHFFILFSFTKSENMRVEQVCQRMGLGCWYQWKVAGKRNRKVNKVKILFTHVCKSKNDSC